MSEYGLRMTVIMALAVSKSIESAAVEQLIGDHSLRLLKGKLGLGILADRDVAVDMDDAVVMVGEGPRGPAF